MNISKFGFFKEKHVEGVRKATLDNSKDGELEEKIFQKLQNALQLREKQLEELKEKLREHDKHASEVREKARNQSPNSSTTENKN